MPDKNLTDNEIVKADVARFKAEINRQKEEKAVMQHYIDHLQAEIERLKPFEDKIAEFNSHIRVEDMLVFANSLEEWLEFCDNLKTEARKEFADKVCDEITDAIINNGKVIKERIEKHNVNRLEDNFCCMCDGKIRALGGIEYFIKKLLKEMESESLDR